MAPGRAAPADRKPRRSLLVDAWQLQVEQAATVTGRLRARRDVTGNLNADRRT
jgi:hypothetical protein